MEEWGTKGDFIKKLSIWENSNDFNIISSAQKEIKDSYGYIPKVLDPFAGGGSIPLECTRLGCETYCSDYNPVSLLILKCVAEFPQKFGKIKKLTDVMETSHENPLLNDLKKWGAWIKNETQKELIQFYPSKNKNETIIGYIWCWSIPCQNPSCGADIPLFSQYNLVQKQNRTISLYPFKSNNKIEFKIVGDGYQKIPQGFDPAKGNYSGGNTICQMCGFVSKSQLTKKIFLEKKSTQKLISIVSTLKGKQGKNFRIASKEDLKIFDNAEKKLNEKQKILFDQWGVNPIPDEPTPKGNGPGAERSFGLQTYGLTTWGDLFNSRQKLTLIVFSEKIRQCYNEMITSGIEKEYAKALIVYLALGVDRLANYGSILCRLNSTGGRGVANTFGTHTMIMVPNYIESNPFNPAGAGWQTSCKSIESFVEHNSKFGNPAKISHCSATKLEHPDNYFDAVFTDPPYYDNIAYSFLSDFFYVWLKRMLGEIYPELFMTSLSPKSDEIVTYGNLEGGIDEGKKIFEEKLKKSFQEINRVLKPDGIAVIVYAHKSINGWETLINSLLESGLVITASWPIHTEMKDRIRSQESAALASSIYMVARKWKKDEIGFYRDIVSSLKKHINTKLDHLWNQGISGADFFISAIGTSMEIFGKYKKIVDDNDQIIHTSKLLEDVRRIVAEYTLKNVLEMGFSSDISSMTRFYVLWRWSYGESKVPFDDAMKLGHGVGLDIVKELNNGFIKKDGVNVRVLGPLDRNEKDLAKSHELIDVLHYALLLWKQGKQDELLTLLNKSEYGKNDVFFKVIESLIHVNIDTDECKLLEGLQGSRIRLEEKMNSDSEKTKLL